MNLEHAILDQIDVQILQHLQKDGRKSFTDISHEMGVSVGMIRNRYQKLIESNILHIIGWTDPVMAGLNAYARVNIKVRPSERIPQIVEKLIEVNEISFVAMTSGIYDIEVNLTCVNNKHLLDTINQKIHAIDGVFETNTTMYLDVRKWAAQEIHAKPIPEAAGVKKKDITKKK